MEAQRQAALDKIKMTTEFMIDSTKRSIDAIKELGMDPPEEMLATQKDHQTILIELKKERPSMNRITEIVMRIDKRVTPLMEE